MSNFETDNQDKSNLVGDAKLMSDAVDVEQELIKFKKENLELKSKVSILNDEVKSWAKRAARWEGVCFELNDCINEIKELRLESIRGNHNG